MPTELFVSAAVERIQVDAQNRGEIMFTVTNPGPVKDRIVFEAVPGDGADPAWFSVDEPQRRMASDGSASYLVRIAVPAGTAAGSYWLQGRAYPADTAPEEASRLGARVAFDVQPAAKPPKRWWPYAVAAGLVLVALAVVGWLLLGRGGEPQVRPSSGPTFASPCRPGFVPREAVPGDAVCVTPQTRDQVRIDNASADSRRSPTGGAYGPNTCLSGYVWREAVPSDLVCVIPETRTQTREDNRLANERRTP